MQNLLLLQTAKGSLEDFRVQMSELRLLEVAADVGANDKAAFRGWSVYPKLQPPEVAVSDRADDVLHAVMSVRTAAFLEAEGAELAVQVVVDHEDICEALHPILSLIEILARAIHERIRLHEHYESVLCALVFNEGDSPELRDRRRQLVFLIQELDEQLPDVVLRALVIASWIAQPVQYF